MLNLLTPARPARSLALALGLFASAGSIAARPAPAAPTFEEVMDQGLAFGEARVSPDGRRVLHEETDNLHAGHGMALPAAHGLYVTDLGTGAKQAIAAEDGRDNYFEACASWSPDSRGVVLIRRRGEEPVLAYVDIATGRSVEFGPQPQTFCNAWVGRKLAYVTSEGNPPSQWSNAGALENLGRRWRGAWEGAVQTTTHSSNPDFPNPEPAVGGLAVADPDTGSAVIVARGQFHVAISPSPDGRRFAVVRIAETIAEPMDRSIGRRGEVQVYELSGAGARLVQSIPDFDVGKGSLAWSPDSRQLLVGGRMLGAALPSLLLLDPEHGGRRMLPQIPGARLVSDIAASSLNIPPIGWIAGRPAALAQVAQSAAKASDATSEYGASNPRAMRLFAFTASGAAVDLTGFARQSIDRFGVAPDGDGLVVADGALWKVGLAHAAKRLTPPSLQVVGLAQARPSYGERAISAIGGGRVALRIRSADSDRIEILDLTSSAVTWSTSADDQVFFGNDLTTAVRIERHGWSSRLLAEGTRVRVVAETNPAWRDRPVGATQRFTYQVGSRTLNGWIVLPPGYVGGRLPAIVWIYGGQVFGPSPPHDALPGEGPTAVFSGQLWARQGYAVVYPSTPLPQGADGDLPEVLASEATAAVDAAAAKGWVDPARVGIMGQSFGGFSTASVLAARSARFRAGISISGVYDFAAAWGARIPRQSLVDDDGHPFVLETLGYVEKGQAGLQAPPWESPEAYRRNSPFYRVASIRSPLMLWVGDFDLGVTDLRGAERFYAALRRTGNPAVLVRYWGEGHVQDDPWAVRDEWARGQAWFAKYLGQPTAVAAAPGATP